MSEFRPAAGASGTRTARARVVRCLEQLRRQMGAGSRLLFGLWLLAMILIPHALRAGGREALLLTVTLSVIAQAGLVLGLLASAWKAPKALNAALLVVVLAWTIEVIGVRAGLPFGGYAYTDALRPQIGHVPIHIPAAWLMMLVPSWAVGEIIVGRAPRSSLPSRDLEARRANLAVSFASGLAVTAWDLFLDPQMVAWNLWKWDPPGIYFGIPPMNFAGWTLTAAVIIFCLLTFAKPPSLPEESLLLVYTAAWLMEAIGMGLFFHMPAAAAVGFAGMGLFVALAWRRILVRPT